MIHDYVNCKTCHLHWLMYGEIFIDTTTSEHVDPRDILRNDDGSWVIRGDGP